MSTAIYRPVKVTWLLIAVVPVFGFLYYLMFGPNDCLRNDSAGKYGLYEISRGQ